MTILSKLFCLILYFTVLIFSQPIEQNPIEHKFELGNVCIISNCFEVEVADRPLLRSLGLMGRKKLPKKSGMWFVFDYLGKYTFWMKNTHIPLDIIFINENYFIVDIFEDARPCKQDTCKLYTPKKNSKYVLELNAGSVKTYDISIGDLAYYTKKKVFKLKHDK